VVGGQRHASAALPQESPGTQCTGGWVDPRGRSGRVRKISPPTGIRSADCPARSHSLYRLSYPGPTALCTYLFYCTNFTFSCSRSSFHTFPNLKRECWLNLWFSVPNLIILQWARPETGTTNLSPLTAYLQKGWCNCILPWKKQHTCICTQDNC
jgi:hypothetical protein